MYYKSKISVSDAVRFGILGTGAKGAELSGAADYVFLYADVAIRFFFASLVFGYFANHMKQRKFRS